MPALRRIARLSIWKLERRLAAGADRLADAIAEPLLDKKYAERERNAVNAELTMARTRNRDAHGTGQRRNH
ncbi:hypothetical protein ACLB1M_21905 [Escherichia coli]